MWAYYIAYLLSLLRLPYTIAPYFTKLFFYYFLGNSFTGFWSNRFIQIVRLVGDFINFAFTSWLIYKLTDASVMGFLLFLLLSVEAIRLLTEKGIMIFSALWQIIPHRTIAQNLYGKSKYKHLNNYCKYYRLSDEERILIVLQDLKAWSYKPQTYQKLKYVNCFQIVSDKVDLRAGMVRDVAKGIIFIHKDWTNNPDILRGQALRRSPWIFDPRYLKRPFFYRTEANRLMTLFVFENARLCPLFAIYQFGHEIKSARYDAFFRIARWLGYELEEMVLEDGTYNFDPFAKKIVSNLLKPNTNKSRTLWSDEEVLEQLSNKPVFTALEIAEKFTYPLIYVEEVLFSKLES